MRIVSNVSADDIGFGAKHTLFVEGEEKSIDVGVLSGLLGIRVKPLGASFQVVSVSQALHKSCPNAYFLVDRDHYDDVAVEEYWRKFPNAETPNLLMWRRKEIESYFIDPAFLCQSDYLRKGKGAADIAALVLKAAKPYVYMAAANRVIVEVREKFKRKWIELFRECNDFPDSASAKSMLLSHPGFVKYRDMVVGVTESKMLGTLFDSELECLTGGADPIEWGRGRWLELLPAKAIMYSVIESSLFVVKDVNNKALTGQDKIRAVVRNLLSSGKDYPTDFKELIKLINDRVRESSSR